MTSVAGCGEYVSNLVQQDLLVHVAVGHANDSAVVLLLEPADGAGRAVVIVVGLDPQDVREVPLEVRMLPELVDEVLELGGLEAPAVNAIIKNIFVVSRIELVLLILIVFDMVLKPGA